MMNTKRTFPCLMPSLPATICLWACLLAYCMSLPASLPAQTPEFEWAVEPTMEYDWVDEFHEGLARARKDGKEGFIDTTGKEVIPFKYNHFYNFSSGLAVFYSYSYYGLIDKTGKEIVPAIYDYINIFSEGLAQVKLNGKWGYINKKGIVKIPIKYDHTEPFKKNKAKIIINGKERYINKYGIFKDKTIDDKFFYILNNKYIIYIDNNDLKINNAAYDYADIIDNNLVKVKLNNKYGIVNNKNEYITAIKYDYIEVFYNNLSVVTLYNKYGYINKQGKEVIPVQYHWAYDFSESLGRVENGNKFGFIDTTGKEVIKIQYEGVSSFSEGLAPIKVNGKWGIAKHPLLYPPKPKSKTNILLIQIGNTSRTEEVSYTVKESRIRIAGKVRNATEVGKVRIGSLNAMLDDESHVFEKEIDLQVGKNEVVIKAQDAKGQEIASRTVYITYEKEGLPIDNAQYYALLIGINEYDNVRKLYHTIDDTKKLKKVLQDRYKFKEENIKVLANLNKADMEKEIVNFIQDINQKEPNNANILLFFAGHGVYIDNNQQGYWLPKDAKNGEVYTFFSYGTLMEYVGMSQARHVLVLADACFSGTICGNKGEEARKDEKLYDTKSRKAMTSGNKEVVPDKSIFMQEFIQYLYNNQEPYLSADYVLQQIKGKVMDVNPTQNPQNCPLPKNEGGDFIFQRKQ